MHPSEPSRQPALAAPFLPPVAALVAIVAYAAQQVDPQAAAETAYLGLLGAAVLLAVAALEAAPAAPGAVRRGGVGATSALLVVLAAWVLPAGPLRGAVVTTLGVAALAIAAARRLAGQGAAGAAGATGVGGVRWAPGFVSSLTLSIPLALAVQVLVRSERLLVLEPGWRFFAGLLGLPVVAAAAAALLVIGFGRAPALVATATAALVGPGFTVATTGSLVVLAAAGAAWPVAGVPARWGAERWVAVAVATTGVAGLSIVDPVAGVAAGFVALLVGGSGAASLAVGAVALVGIVALPGATGWRGEVIEVAMTVAPLALVLGLSLTARATRRWAGAALALGLVAVVAARLGVAPSGLAAPLAALPLVAGRSLAGHRPVERHALFAPQAAWSAAFLATTVLAAAYPWLRARPAASALALFGVPVNPSGLALVAGMAGAAVVLAVAVQRASRWLSARGAGPTAEERSVTSGIRPRRVAAWAVAFLVLAVVAALPSPRRSSLLTQPVALAADRARLEVELPAAAGSSAAGRLVVVVDSSLSHAVAVPAATPVATLRVASGGDLPRSATATAAAWTLRAGDDTAEWAIRRPDVAAAAAHSGPRPWLARVTDQGFFGLTFRSVGELPLPVGGGHLVIERHPSLPVEAVVHLYRIEVGR